MDKKPIEVLVVEDDPDWQEIVHRRLKEFGVNVTVAGNLSKALKIAAAKKHDLYPTDGSYPLKPGEPAEDLAYLKFFEEIRKLRPDAQVVAVSGHLRQESEARRLGIEILGKDKFYDGIGGLLQKYFGK